MPPTDALPTPTIGPWSRVWRYLVVVLVGATLLALTANDLYSPASTVSARRADGIVLLDIAGALVGIALMPLRRRWPVRVAVAATILTCFSASAVAPWSTVMVSLATRRRVREVVPVTVLSLVATVANGLVNPMSNVGLPWWVSEAIGLLVCGILVMIGFYVGARRELLAGLRLRADTAERDQAMRVAQAREAERTRIAREMHDVLAHRISLVAMHAGALSYREDLSPEETRRAATVIQEGAHAALADLRDVLGVLRDPTAQDDDARRPQPTWGDLPGLVDESARGGQRVMLDDAGVRGCAVPDALGRTVYRMVQEALTNALKHAPGMPVTVLLTGRPGARLVLEVRNPLQRPDRPGALGPLPGAGMGLTGMAERAALAGGEWEHGPLAAGQFVVRASLPWPAVATGTGSDHRVAS